MRTDAPWRAVPTALSVSSLENLEIPKWVASFAAVTGRLPGAARKGMTVNASIFWYDYETTGIDPRRDRPLQIAGIRTDEALNEIGEPMNLYCRPSDDILPHPMACLITGITPQRLAERGCPRPTS